MCIAVQEIKEEGRLEGRLEGELIGVIHTYKKMNFSFKDVNGYIMEEYEKSEEEIDELLMKYWK